jgi:hypothetical protein
MKAVKSFRICNQPQIYTGISKIKIPGTFTITYSLFGKDGLD